MTGCYTTPNPRFGKHFILWVALSVLTIALFAIGLGYVSLPILLKKIILVGGYCSASLAVVNFYKSLVGGSSYMQDCDAR